MRILLAFHLLRLPNDSPVSEILELFQLHPARDEKTTWKLWRVSAVAIQVGVINFGPSIGEARGTPAGAWSSPLPNTQLGGSFAHSGIPPRVSGQTATSKRDFASQTLPTRHL